MKNYLISNSTVALIKDDKKTIVYDVENIKVINKHINTILETNCNLYGSTLKGRINCIKKEFEFKYKIPILVSPNNKIILIQIYSKRNENCIFLNINNILNYKYENKILKIYCKNDYIFDLNITKYSFEKSLINAYRINMFYNY